MLVGSALRLTVGGAGGGGTMTVTAADAVASPPGPVHVSVKVVPVVSAADRSDPLPGLAPLQPLDAVHDVALSLAQES